MRELKRILFAIPIPYTPPESFWVRESGLIVLALREMGYDAWLITLGDPAQDKAGERPVFFASLEEMSSGEWWQKQHPDAVALNLWSAPRYDAVRKAALKATPRVVERLDTSGVRIPRIWPSYSFVQTWGGMIDVGKNRWAALLPALGKHLIFRFFPNVMERPMALTMAQLPYVVAESPLAAARILRHLRWHTQDGKVAQISNPVLTSHMRWGGDVSKKNHLVSVARWDAFQKDFPRLLAVAADFLQLYPDWSFDLVGRGTEKFQHLIEALPSSVRKRILVHGALPQAEVAKINRAAKIHFLASRWEGFCNASIEALCCGCSYVGPINIAGSSYLIENRSGTLASSRGEKHLLDALCSEAEAWKAGRRNPEEIARAWKAEAGYQEVAIKTLRLFESIV